MRKYHVIFIVETGKKKGQKEYMTVYSMVHSEACTMLSKQSKHKHGRFQLEEVY